MGKLVVCRFCGEKIELMRTDNRKTVPCQRDVVSFIPSGGPDTFVMDDGRVYRGERDRTGKLTGHPKHAKYCKEKMLSGRL